MKILFFMVHPAHFHLFKNVIKKLKAKNHEIRILIKTKDVLQELLDHTGWEYKNTLPFEKRSTHTMSVIFSALYGLLIREFKLAKEAFRNRPDIFVGTEWSLAHIGALLNIPSLIVNEDDTQATPENYLVYPFANTIVTPGCVDVGKWEKRKVTYKGYHELAYLHPKYFSADKSIVKMFNPKGDPYFLLRFVKLSASHDVGKKGIDNEIAHKIISILSPKGNVYITSEKKLDPDLQKYRIKLDPYDIHHAINYAQILIGDSQTMTTEAAMLGTPSIRFNDFIGKCSTLEELEHKYRLTYGISGQTPQKLYDKLEDMLNYPRLKEEWQIRRQKMLSEKIDVTAFMVWLIENYPQSVSILKKNPDYQYRFK